MGEETRGSSRGVALEGRLGQAYSEEAFRYFLEIERKRASRLADPASCCWSPETPVRGQRANQPGPRTEAVLVFNGSASARPTSLVGTRRSRGRRCPDSARGRTASTPRIRQRVTEALAESLRPKVARRFQVHVYQLKPKPNN